MQKFEESHEAISERKNIVVMADEAHRSQYGLTEKVDSKTGRIKIGAARAIRNTLPNATYIDLLEHQSLLKTVVHVKYLVIT